MNDKAKGYLFGAISAITYGMNPLFALPLYSDGMEPISVLFFRYIFAIPMLALLLYFRGHGFAVERKQIFPLSVLGLLMAISSITLFKSYLYMDVGIASTLLFVYPIIVAFIMVFFFKEKLSVQIVLCLILALTGIALLYKAEDGTTLSATGTLLVFASSLSYAVYIVLMNKSTLNRVPTIKVILYVLFFGSILLTGVLLFQGAITLPTRPYLWLNLVALAVFPTIISLVCTTYAIKYIGPTPTAILGALEPVTAVIFGITIFGETLSVRECIGLVLIIVAVSMVVAGSNISDYLVRIRKMFPKFKFPRR